jgi:probable phosphoglycerate mutase
MSQLNPERRPPPAGVRTTSPGQTGATRIVLVRHGEAVCNINGVVGGFRGCTGLTATGVEQVAALRDRLARTGELTGVDALYASVLPRAVETAEIVAPALDRWRDGPPLRVVTDCDLCELHPGEADGLTWGEYSARFPEPDWDDDPTQLLAPGGESWLGFVERASAAVTRLADAHPGEQVVAACHAGVIESTVLRFLPVDQQVVRLGLQTEHASLTVWERGAGQWFLRRYNDVTPRTPGGQENSAQQA